MKITFVLLTLSLTGSLRVLSIYTEVLQKRGHKIFIVSMPPRQATLIQQLRSRLRGRGWQSAAKNSLTLTRWMSKAEFSKATVQLPTKTYLMPILSWLLGGKLPSEWQNSLRAKERKYIFSNTTMLLTAYQKVE